MNDEPLLEVSRVTSKPDDPPIPNATQTLEYRAPSDDRPGIRVPTMFTVVVAVILGAAFVVLSITTLVWLIFTNMKDPGGWIAVVLLLMIVGVGFLRGARVSVRPERGI